VTEVNAGRRDEHAVDRLLGRRLQLVESRPDVGVRRKPLLHPVAQARLQSGRLGANIERDGARA
jgi:hypothetical protein